MHVCEEGERREVELTEAAMDAGVRQGNLGFFFPVDWCDDHHASFFFMKQEGRVSPTD
jgi:hypothetical protein